MKSPPLSHPSPELLDKTVDGILFSAPMILALLAGRKTVTRRTSKRWLKRKPGDLLFVRETWAPTYGIVCERGIVFRADGALQNHCPEPKWTWCFNRGAVHYAEFHKPHSQWRSAMHLPREFSRLVLRVTEPPRIERVNAITEEDAAREGVTPTPHDPEGDCWATGKHITAFEYLWNELHGWEPNNFNEVNPEVVRIPFEIVGASLEAEQVGKGTA